MVQAGQCRQRSIACLDERDPYSDSGGVIRFDEETTRKVVGPASAKCARAAADSFYDGCGVSIDQSADARLTERRSSPTPRVADSGGRVPGNRGNFVVALLNPDSI